jgi:hypothetical protein
MDTLSSLLIRALLGLLSTKQNQSIIDPIERNVRHAYGGGGTVYRAFCAQPVHVKVSGQFTMDKPSLASNWVERNGSVALGMMDLRSVCPTKLEGTAEDVVEGFTYFQYLMRAQILQGKRQGAWSAPSCAAVSNVTFQAVAQ